MGYEFTSEQEQRIRTAFQQAQVDGEWSRAYELVADIVASEPDATGSTPINTDPEVQASRLWLLGAAQANAGGEAELRLEEREAGTFQVFTDRPVATAVGARCVA